MKYLFSILLLSLFWLKTEAQNDEAIIKSIYNESLTQSPSYDNLKYLTKSIGNRLSGSPQAAAAVEFTRQLMKSYDLDTVFLQPVMVPHWVRGEKEELKIVSNLFGTYDLTITALGNSIGTGAEGIVGKVIEVQDIEDLEKLGKKKIDGHIVFFNKGFDFSIIDPFQAYGTCIKQRVNGASEAAKYGAVGVIVRSLASQIDDVPHTGSLKYEDGVKQIPAIAVSTLDADFLSKTLKLDLQLKVFFKTTCKMEEMELSYNVIGQLNGTEKSDEFILVGAHLDSWDVGEGAHDDGGGCMQSIEVLRIFKKLGIQPKHNLRAVMFMNEENGRKGGDAYADIAIKNNEKHIIALESDRGVFSPRGFTIEDPNLLNKIKGWASLFESYGIYEFIKGGGGSDISPLKNQSTKMIGFLPDAQRYFTLHHTAADVFEVVDKRELEMGSATITSLIYLLDKYGL